MQSIGYMAAVLTVIAFLPQVFQVIKTRKTRDISLATYSTLVATGTLWTIYGIGISDPAIYLTNAVVGSLCLIVVIMKIRDHD